MQQKMTKYSQGLRARKISAIERNLESAWNDLRTMMSHDEFITAAHEAAMAICLRDRLTERLLDRPEKEAA